MSAETAGTTAADTAYDWVLRYVAALPWDEDAFLNEKQLAEQAQVSRTPIREALLRLEVDGLIRRVPYRGTYVPAMSQRDIDSIFEARGLIEDWAVERATELRSDCGPLFELIDEQRALTDDPVAFNSLDLKFHGHIVGAGRNPILADLYRSLRNRQLRLGVWAVMIRENRTASVIDEHLAIATAIDAGDVDAAVTAVRTHLGSTIAAIRSGATGPHPGLATRTD
ncbi:GntR family transcriptional regulator [Pseudoclavibacter endophyticus]|nr:GntR family transcriptional regulator [Pseudoclavibacter endophyticus]